jgi:hypothetical protein
VGVKERDGAIIDLGGVSRCSKELLVWGEAVDVDILETLPKLEILNVYKIRSKDLPKVQRIGELSLRNLSLRFWAEPDLTAFNFPKNLERLTVWQSNKFVRLDGIQTATDLDTLILNDNGRLETLEPIRALPKLKVLHLTGGIWTKQQTDGLEALAGLKTLRALHLRGIDGRGVDLTPVTQLPNLELLDLWGRDFPMEQVAKVAAAHPMFLEELLELDDFGESCKTCGGTKKLMFVRRHKAFWCPVCEKKGLDRLLDKFMNAVEQARRELRLEA